MREHDLYTPLINGANGEGWALVRLPDGAGLPERPADITGGAGGWKKGIWTLVEVKVVEKYRGLSSLHFESSQKRWLQICYMIGGLPLVAVYEESTRKMHLIWVCYSGMQMLGARRAELKRGPLETWIGWNAALEGWRDTTD